MRYRRAAAALALSDANCLAIGLLLVHVLGAVDLSGRGSRLLLFIGAPVMWGTVFAAFGLYRVQRLATADHLRDVLFASTVGCSFLVFLLFDPRSSARSAFVLMWTCVLLLEVTSRHLWKAKLRRMRRGGVLGLRTVVIGTHHEADRLVHSLIAPDSGYNVVGYVSVARTVRAANTLPVLGDMQDLAALVRHHAADCVFVASSEVTPVELAAISRVARRQQLEVRISAALPEVIPSRVTVELANGIAALSLTPVRLTPAKAAIKRLFDVVVGSVLLLAALPVMVVIAGLVRLTSRGPVIFRQDRVTKDGRIFEIFKFRTMFIDDDLESPSLGLDPTRTYFKLQDDPRVTKLGKALRRFSLDELPQLWNVVRGDLSLVGPRPLWALQVDPALDMFRHRHEVRAGLTGWWQVNGRSSIDGEEALKMDLFYIENWSLWLDLSILLRTIPVVLTSRAAY